MNPWLSWSEYGPFRAVHQGTPERRYLINVSERTAECYNQAFRWLPNENPTEQDLKQVVVAMRDGSLKPRSVNSYRTAINASLFHELVHSTGHPNRLNRSTLTDFERWGDATYSKEELVAELGASFLAGFSGIENTTLSNSAAYLTNWLHALRQDSRMIVIAASQAQKATDLILNVSAAVAS